jgi:hypothetical protein
MKIKSLLLSLSLCLLFFSCKKDEVTELLVSVSPSDFQIEANPGDIIPFRVKAKTNNTLTKLIITQRLSTSVDSDTLKVIGLSGKETSQEHLYLVSELANDTTLVYVNFTVQQSDGQSITMSKRVLNIKENIALLEKSGNVFYSHKSVATQPDAYSLSTSLPKFSNISPVSELQIADDTLNNTVDAISKSWISYTGAMFRKDNGFDYVNASAKSVKNAFESGLALDKATNLANGDIVLVKLLVNGLTKFVAIKITGVIDNQGFDNDRYEFNYKM